MADLMKRVSEPIPEALKVPHMNEPLVMEHREFGNILQFSDRETALW
jgi:hypothetical protein